MAYSASDLRKMAREALKGKWKTAILMTIIAAILGGMVVGRTSFDVRYETGQGMILETPWLVYGLMKDSIWVLILAVFSFVWAIVQLIIGAAVNLGISQFFMNLIRKEEAEVKTLFVHKNRVWFGLVLDFLVVLYTILWTFCLIVPGIMALFDYALIYYIANDHPEMTANQVIKASKEMMKGNRWRLFCLEISFIGWDLIGALTLGIGSFAIAPYKEATYACFYQDLCEKKKGMDEEFYEL